MMFSKKWTLFGTLMIALAWGIGFPEGTFSEKMPGSSHNWSSLEPGLELGTFTASKKSIVGDSHIRILRIDPTFFKFKLLNASAQTWVERHSAKTWAEQFELTASINASMYQADNVTSVSLMKTPGHTNNTWFSKDRALLAFDPIDPELPAVQILDRDCQDVPSLRKKYRTLIQSIRMISCDGKNVWQQRKKQWSTSAIGTDKRGRVLFIHSRSPYSTHDLIEILMDLPIELNRAMYVEGGAEAQMYVHSGDLKAEFVGSYSTGSNENDANKIGWPIPNVVGIQRKSAQKR